MIRPRVLFIILAMVLLLFLQIEAAQAGLLSRWRVAFGQLFTPFVVISGSVSLMVVALVYFAFFDKSLNLNESHDSEH